MTPGLILFLLMAYFLVLIIISLITSRKTTAHTFFTADKSSPWYLVAFGMIGASLSGVTFVSIPGIVNTSYFSYMQVVFGYLLGYIVIAYVLMPIYYKLNLTSIYSYLEQRFGQVSYKTGAVYFMLSRIAGASIRLLLVAGVLQQFVFEAWGVPFAATVAISILLIWLYTFRAGIKTVVWTDTLQTAFMLIAVLLTIYLILEESNWSLSEGMAAVDKTGMSRIFFLEDIKAKNFFWKELLGGMFIAIGMTGLDQDMMQKNLTCKTLKEAQKNMVSFSVVLVVVNLFFLFLGALLFVYAAENGVVLPTDDDGKIIADQVYPTIALSGSLGLAVGVFFLLGLVAAAYSSADSALTSLTTSFCVDFLEIEKKKGQEIVKTRESVHIAMSIVIFIVVLIFKETLDKSAIGQVLYMGALTYGPLVGLYAFGIFTKYKVKDRWVWLICVLSPVVCYLLGKNSALLFNGYLLGNELILVNGLLTFGGLWCIRK